MYFKVVVPTLGLLFTAEMIFLSLMSADEETF